MKFDAKDLTQFEQFVGVTKTNIELQNSRGQTMVLELEPLASKYFGKIMYVQERMPKPKLLNPVEHKSGRPARYETEESMLARLQEEDYDSWSQMLDLLKVWIKQSYPDIPEPAMNKLLITQTGVFLNEFMKLHNDIDDETGKTKALKDFVADKREKLANEKDTNSETTAEEQVGV